VQLSFAIKTNAKKDPSQGPFLYLISFIVFL